MTTSSTTEETIGATAPDEADAASKGAVPTWAPLALVVLAVGFNLWTLRAQVLPVAYPNDSAIHASMVRWAGWRIGSGHVPLDGWYPNLSLGAARFHHYQSLPHVLTGGLSALFGPGVFPWTLYLLLALWPAGVYGAARLFDLGRWEAGVAALVSPFVVSEPGLGYEWGSYVWRGSGAWTQLWGMWALPFALALGWRAVSRRGSLALAAAPIALTICVHVLTGYLALLCLGIWVLVRPGELRTRLPRAALVGAGALAAAAWFLLPLIADADWTIRDEFSVGTFYYDSFGAGRVMGWLFTGGIFDAGRLPVISVAVGVGVGVAIARFRRSEHLRAILAAGALSLLLFFGRPTLGPVLDLLPGGGDLFLRRYVSGVHLAGILLAGVGAVWFARKLAAWTRTRTREVRVRPVVAAAAAAIVGLGVLAPAILERHRYAAQDATWIDEQRVADDTDGAAFRSLVERARTSIGGRVHAGLRSVPSSVFWIGRVPAYAWLLEADADAVGFTRPTWSLMSGAEARFDPTDAGHLALFGVRALILPNDQVPSVPAVQVGAAGRFTLWRVGRPGYLRVVDTVAPVAVDRSDLGSGMDPFLSSDLPTLGRYPTVAFGGRPAATPTLGTEDSLEKPSGYVLRSAPAPSDGVFQGRVLATRNAVVALSASFDPRWHAFVDGVERPVQMLAPALPGVAVESGEHSVLFVYEPVSSCLVLIALGLIALAGLTILDRRPQVRSPGAP